MSSQLRSSSRLAATCILLLGSTFTSATYIPEPWPAASLATAEAESKTLSTDAIILQGRQQQPFSVSSAIATTVDSKHYSIDQSNTNFVGSNPAALSSNTVTVTSGAYAPFTKATAAQVGMFTATANGKTEYSLFVAPDLAEKIQGIVYSTSLSAELPQTGKRGLIPNLPPASIINGLIDLLGPELAASFIKRYNIANSQFDIVALGTKALGYIPLLGATMEFGGILYSVVTVLELYANTYMSFKSIDRNTPKGFPHSVNTCAKGLQCVDCAGVNGVCVAPNTGCNCENKEQNKCPKAAGTNNGPIDCNVDECKHNDQKLCTADPNRNCPCAFYGGLDKDTYSKDYATGIQHFMDLVNSKPAPAAPKNSGTLSCSENSAETIAQWVKLADDSKVKPKDVLYKLRETLCSNKCEVPANIPATAAVVTSNGPACTIRVGVSANELFASRATAATGTQQTACWDSLQTIAEQCFKNAPNKGVVNGLDGDQSYEAGIRSQTHDALIHGGLLPTSVMCSQCGGPAQGGTCSASDGKFPGELCCPTDQICCGDQRCNGKGGACTGALNGCICAFNGGKCG
ncbi:hypothetical protein BDV95DRAFT_673019 [Massariosphaeria phaeospora]|uniref:Uncharacterized protein n=1 Tax=Massariosphaeria phaeospora TaxID=100035 RepID=A0A7C8M3V8_9PLEO|nr:hypothetical protein BDV95DRAFT_673019 [Massariosphaeria phaeospora]